MELLLLLVILPAVQDQNHTREWLKNCIKGWCSVAAWFLDLRSYLFGDVAVDGEEELPENDLAPAPAPPEEERDQAAEQLQQQPEAEQHAQPDAEEEEDVDHADVAAVPIAAAGAAGNADGLGAAHQALLQREAPTGTQPYVRPVLFPLRVREMKIQGYPSALRLRFCVLLSEMLFCLPDSAWSGGIVAGWGYQLGSNGRKPKSEG